MRLTAALAIAGALITTNHITSAAEVEFYNSTSAQQQTLPFSQAVRVDDLLILSGILGTESRTASLVKGGIIPETHQIFVNMKQTLEGNGLDFGNVVKCTVMLADIDDYADFNAIYATYFPGNKPARSAFAASGLAFDAAVELECWAAFPADHEDMSE